MLSKLYLRFTLATVIFLVIFNTVVIFYLRKVMIKRKGVKGLRVSDDGSMIFNMEGLFYPPKEPPEALISDKVINPHDYSYLLNPVNACSNKSVEIIVCVVSSVNNFDKRRGVRHFMDRFMGDQATFHMILLFFLGATPPIDSLKRRIKSESNKYQDIVQEDFLDTPRNLSVKSVSFLKWVTLYCPHSKFTLKMDDDTQIDMDSVLLAMTRKFMDYPHYIMGDSRYYVEGPIRNKSSKYYTSEREYPSAYYPIFAHGPAYGFPTKTAGLLYNASLQIALFWLEDVYVTGICARKANVPVFFDKHFVYKHVSIDAV